MDLKREAARAALEHVESGMRLGLGTGSTADHFIDLLGEKVKAGFDVVCVPTSERTAARAAPLGIRLTTLDETPELDLTVDGADEIGPRLVLIKGGGGALLREKIVAAASHRMIVIADQSKVVDAFGVYPLPIEVMPFGLEATRRAIAAHARAMDLPDALALRRKADGTPFVTDGGHYIIDASFRRIPDPWSLARALVSIPGVVEHGLFIDMAGLALVAGSDGVIQLEP